MIELYDKNVSHWTHFLSLYRAIFVPAWGGYNETIYIAWGHTSSPTWSTVVTAPPHAQIVTSLKNVSLRRGYAQTQFSIPKPAIACFLFDKITLDTTDCLKTYSRVKTGENQPFLATEDWDLSNWLCPFSFRQLWLPSMYLEGRPCKRFLHRLKYQSNDWIVVCTAGPTVVLTISTM